MASTSIQNLRLRRPEPSKPTTPAPARHTGILQDQLRRSARRPWNPKFSMAVRILLLVRVAGAMYSNIQDCDEVFNFWEPLHFLDRGHGFQTWEVSPVYAIRSWAYIILHLLPARIPALLLGPDKRPAFFAVRISLALMSSFCEATLYRTVVEKVNERVGRYLFFMLLCSAGMWNASTAFLPSTFAMYTSTLAFTHALSPASLTNNKRTLLSTLLYATGAIVGWPFALALAIPFVFEELSVLGGDRIPLEEKERWIVARWKRILGAGVLASLIFLPVIGIDTIAYGRFTIVPRNIIQYNIFGGPERGPNLYGTSPLNFYILNLLLNFNVLLPLSLLSLPALYLTSIIDRRRIGFPLSKVKPGEPEQSSGFVVLGLRLAPLYVWMGILMLQAHKEERFMFPAYPLVCFNAAVALYLMRGWMEVVYIRCTSSPYKASRSSLFSWFTTSVVCGAALISLSRILALWTYYHAPQTIYFLLETKELPRLLNSTNLLPLPPPSTLAEDLPRIDLTPVKHFNLTLCVGKEWYRFPGHYLVPDGVRVDFVKSEFEGLVPGHFEGAGESSGWWWRDGTRRAPDGLNDLNREEPRYYVPVETCDYLVDLDFPHHPSTSSLEPRYAVDAKTWDRVACVPFLDASHSSLLTRTLWMPGQKWQSINEYGDYCLLRNRKLVGAKETRMRAGMT